MENEQPEAQAEQQPEPQPVAMPTSWAGVDSLLEFAEKFGLERKEIGTTLLKFVLKGGKLDLAPKEPKKSGFEHLMIGLKEGIPFYVALFLLWLGYRWVTHVWMP